MRRNTVPIALAVAVLGIGGAVLVARARKRPQGGPPLTVGVVASGAASSAPSVSFSVSAAPSPAPPPVAPPPPKTFAERLFDFAGRREKTKHPNRLDVDGDGYGDVLATGCTSRAGGVAFVYGLGDIFIGTANGVLLFYGTRAGAAFTFRPSEFHASAKLIATDIDNDGFGDLVQGDGGALKVWRGSKDGPVDWQTIVNEDAPTQWPTDLYAGSP